MPARKAFGPKEQVAIAEVLAYYQEEDPGYQGHFEEIYTQQFATWMGGGFADAVATGTVSLYVALAALNLPRGSEVLVSPITDPGTLSAMVLLGLVPRVVDSQADSFNLSLESFQARLTPKTKAAVIVHSVGQAAPIAEICAFAPNLLILEDCSQAHGATYQGQKVGRFGHIAAFSTMYRKASITGSTGGVVYTQDEILFHQALAHADRGKPRWLNDFDDRNPNEFLFPALNLHSNEINCAIGSASLGRLNETIRARLHFVEMLTSALYKHSKVCTPYVMTNNDSPFVLPIFVDVNKIKVSKIEFAQALRAEGIPLNPHYQYLVCNWPWLQPYLSDTFDCPTARAMLDRCFCLYLNERYGQQEVADIIQAIDKVETELMWSRVD
jgi:dTDP-4-amino-4,6-dideoxygalactose transaminase